MSGICGMVSEGFPQCVNVPNLSRMAGSLRFNKEGNVVATHVGAAGLGVCQNSGYDGGIAQKQLHGRTVALAFHGRLYNINELRALGDDGRAEMSSVLLERYLQKGMGLVEQIRGEFTIAVWDERDDACYLATDRFRVAPLFYYHDGLNLVFASRMNGIVACPLQLDYSVQPESIVDIMAFSSICSPRTIFHQVKKLPPGHILSYKNGAIRVTSCWDINFLKPSGAGQSELSRRLKESLKEALKVRLESDHPSSQIGTFLSGGIDSSTVTGILTNLTQAPVKSFSIGFDETKFDEMRFARIAARHFGSQHYEYFVKAEDVRDSLPVLLDSFDEPFANASAIPTYCCAKLAKQCGVNVMYAGDGGDELFAGNERYGTQRLFDYYGRIPAWLRKGVVEPVMGAVADYVGGRYPRGVMKYIRRANIPYPQRLTSYGLFNIIPTADLLSDDLNKAIGRAYDPYSPLAFHYFQAPAETELDRQLYVDLKLTIGDNDLFKVTRMTQAAGIAVRYPFLDHHVAELAAIVPADMKMRGRELRTFFKEAYADLLPEATRKKTKHGFGLPIPVWLKTDKQLHEMMLDLVLSPKSLQRGYFQQKALETIVERHRHDESSFYGTILWNVMILELWHRRHAEAVSLIGANGTETRL